MHILCTICSDLVNQIENIYVTKCGHIFHHHCLSQWIERSQTCPQCRNKVTGRCMFRVYPTVSSESGGEDAATLQSRLDDAQLQLRQQRTAQQELADKFAALTEQLQRSGDLLKSTEKKLVSKETAVSALKDQLEYVKIQNRETQRLKEENEVLKKNMQTLTALQKVLNATADEVEQMLEGYSDVRTIATFATALKRALCESESKKRESRDALQAARSQLALERSAAATSAAAHRTVLEELEQLKAQMSAQVSGQAGHKRKSVDLESGFIVDSVSKVRREDPEPENSADVSLNSLVRRIESADSPYLALRRSTLALSALQHRHSPPAHDRLKPSERGIINTVKAIKRADTEIEQQNKPFQYTIFNQKQRKVDLLGDETCTDLEVSFDGLGGHSKIDTFPVPKNRPVPKSCIPKVTARHKLKRPDSNSQDISKMLSKLKDK